MSTEDNIAIAAVRLLLLQCAASSQTLWRKFLPRMPLSVPCAVVGWREHMPPSKGTRVTTNMSFVRRSSSPLSSGRLYKTPVRQRRLLHAHKSRRGYKGPANSRNLQSGDGIKPAA